MHAIVASTSAFVSLKKQSENKLSKARWSPSNQICNLNAVSATSQTFLLMTPNHSSR